MEIPKLASNSLGSVFWPLMVMFLWWLVRFESMLSSFSTSSLAQGNIFLLGQLLGAFAQMMDLILVLRWNRVIGLPDILWLTGTARVWNEKHDPSDVPSVFTCVYLLLVPTGWDLVLRLLSLHLKKKSDVPKGAKRSLHRAVNLCKVFPRRWDLWTDYGKDVLCSCGDAGLQGLSCEFGSNNICNPHSHKQHRLLVSAISDLDLFIAKGFDMFC